MRRTRRAGWNWQKAFAVAVITAGVLGVAGVGWADRAQSEKDAKANAIAQMEQTNARQRANAPKGEKPAAAQKPAGPACNAVAWDQGVSDTKEAPIPGGTIEVTTVWAQTVGQRNFAVYAGSVAGDPSRGLVIVQTYTLCGHHVSDEDYPAPAGLGRVRITEATGHQLILSTDAGARVVFDVDTRKYSG